MTRAIKDAKLDSRTAREQLKTRREPYWRLVEPGLYLGYLKRANAPGNWLARRFNGKDASGSPYTRTYLKTADGHQIIADDYADADGNMVRSFAQAQRLLQADHRPKSGERAAAGPFTIDQAMDYYLECAEHEKGNIDAVKDARTQIAAFIRPSLGSLDISKITADRLRKWLRALAAQAPRLRTRKGEKQKFAAMGTDAETIRRRRATANRTFHILKAGVNKAFFDGKAEYNIEWRRVQPFKNVDGVRKRYLTIEQCKRALNAADEDFAKLIGGALQSGARYGQLIALKASDFDARNGTLQLSTRKGNGQLRVYHAVLSKEGVDFFADLAAGLADDDLIFRKANGEPWAKSDQQRPMEETCKRAQITPRTVFHILRHTWASHSVMNGIPLMVVAENLGHTDTRMVEKHYGHLAPSFKAKVIREKAPRFGMRRSNVRTLSRAA